MRAIPGIGFCRRRHRTTATALVLMTLPLSWLIGVLHVGAAAAATAPPDSSGSSGSSGPSCGGTVIDQSTRAPWHCTFDDEFTGTSLNAANWVVQQTADSGYTSGGECYTGSPNNVWVAGGYLHLSARREAAPFTCPDPFGNYTTQYTGGMVTTDGRFSQTYGLFEVRAKLPAATVPGLQEAFWLWPVNPMQYGIFWPASGEIDFAEMYSLYPDLDVPFIHYNADNDANVTTDTCAIANPTQFHTYGLEWTPTSMSILLDGKTCLTDTWNPALPLIQPEPFNMPFFLNLTQALGLVPNAYGPTTPLPEATVVDWVRIWS
jgi:beta-glucanase (GH16 family)